MHASTAVENNEIVCIFSYWNETNLFVLSILKISLSGPMLKNFKFHPVDIFLYILLLSIAIHACMHDNTGVLTVRCWLKNISKMNCID